MKYRPLGETGLKVSVLSLGASSLGGVFHAIDEKEAIKTVHTAVDNGINFIDVSPYYGFTNAEKVLGRALENISRDKYYLSTKVGRYGENGVKTFDYSAKRAEQSIAESLERLKLDYIDLISVHDIEFSDINLVINETLPALNRLKEKGLVRHVGITGLPLSKLKTVIEAVPSNMVETILSFCHYALNDDSLADSVPFFQEHKVGVINASPLSMALLTERGAPDWHPASDKIKKYCKMASEFCKKEGYKIEKLAIKFSTENEAIPTTLVSTSNSANILNNISWVEDFQNNELLKEVLNILAPIKNETWENS